MDRQLTVRMSEELAERLEQVARHLRRRRSEVVRLALEQFLQGIAQEKGESETERPIGRVRDLLGRVASGIPDLGRRHREHLLARLRRSRNQR